MRRISHTRRSRLYRPGDKLTMPVSLQRAQGGDRQAFIALAEQHLPALYRFVAREIRYHEALGNLAPDEVDVEDVLDEVFLTALRQLHRRPRRATFKGWLRHLALQKLRRVIRASRGRRRYEPVHLEDPLPNGRRLDASPVGCEVDLERPYPRSLHAFARGSGTAQGDVADPGR